MVRSLLLWVLLCATAQASEMMDQLETLQRDPVAGQKAYEAASERIQLCAKCHGKDGNSLRGHIPNLAGQNPQYLFDAFEKYVTHQRKDFVMNQAASMLTLKDRVNIAFYFSQQKVTPRTVVAADEVLLKQGEQRFQTVCVACHGSQGLGNGQFPRITSQPEEYLLRALQRYRAKDPSRAGSAMLAIAGVLDESDLPALATYLSRQFPNVSATKTQ